MIVLKKVVRTFIKKQTFWKRVWSLRRNVFQKKKNKKRKTSVRWKLVSHFDIVVFHPKVSRFGKLREYCISLFANYLKTDLPCARKSNDSLSVTLSWYLPYLTMTMTSKTWSRVTKSREFCSHHFLEASVRDSYLTSMCLM